MQHWMFSYKIISILLTISVEKVIVMICGPCALYSPADEAILTQTVGSIFKDTDKGVVVWVKDNKVPAPDSLLELIVKPMSSIVNTQPQTSYSGDFAGSANTAQAATNPPTDRQYVQKSGGHMSSRGTHRHPLQHNQNVHQSQQTVLSQPIVKSSSTGYIPSKGEYVMLKTRLFNGSISFHSGHLEIRHPGFEVPEYIVRGLWEEHFNTPEAVLKIISDRSGTLRWSVEPKSKSKTSQQHSMSAVEDGESIHLKNNETVMLHARVRYGLISLEKGDLQYIYPQWDIPEYITQSLERDYHSLPNGELFVISDEEGNLRHNVIIARTDKALGMLYKARKSIRKKFS